ncbi:MAG TPA: sugar isomerase domain-containing protein [Clostridiales bacterium]|nr:sugar isomerase domain-containing protein [Clostridiales bacterium]
MLMERFFNAVSDLNKKIQDEQAENIKKAAEIIVDSIEKGGAVHIFDTGHLINSELIGRAGGLMLMKALNYSFNVDSKVRIRDNKGKNTSMEGLSKYVLAVSNVIPGDVLIIGSVSGKTVRPVDMAIAARELGVTVIALTSVAYSSSLESEHSCGKRLFELADLVLDNCAPVGDAMLEVEGINTKVCPASGLAAAYIMWALNAEIIELMLNRGMTPSVYKSINFPDGSEYNDKVAKEYQEKGY